MKKSWSKYVLLIVGNYRKGYCRKSFSNNVKLRIPNENIDNFYHIQIKNFIWQNWHKQMQSTNKCNTLFASHTMRKGLISLISTPWEK